MYLQTLQEVLLKMARKQVQISLDPELKKEIDTLKDFYGIPIQVSRVCSEALKKELRRVKTQLGIKRKLGGEKNVGKSE